VFQNFSSNSVIKSNIQAYLMCFDTGTAPAVGYTRTLWATNVTSASVSNDWWVLENQALGGTTCDLIVKGTINGARHGLLYQSGSNNYKPDTTNLSTFTHAQLLAKVQAGDTLTIMGVPPGSGTRMGIDRDLDGVLDADVPPPRLQIARAGANAVLNWPLRAAGYLPESADVLPASAWSSVTDAVEIVSSQNFLTNAPVTGAKFFRLRQP
jgi:hypothetical protein